MLYGRQMVWNIENLAPNFKDYECKELPLEEYVFKRDQLFRNPKKLITSDEDFDKDDTGNSCPGGWLFDDAFNLIILNNMENPGMDDEAVQAQLDRIPNIDQFVKYYISPPNQY